MLIQLACVTLLTVKVNFLVLQPVSELPMQPRNMQLATILTSVSPCNCYHLNICVTMQLATILASCVAM